DVQSQTTFEEINLEIFIQNLSVSLWEHPLCVDWALFPFPSKKAPKRVVVPLVTQSNLAHVVDERW
ncbi:hypothetical protein L0F63_004864, partial [Massospora cicadina]